MAASAPVAPPDEIVEFLSTLRLPAGMSATELDAALDAAMNPEPWPVVGSVHERVVLHEDEPALTADIVLPATGKAWPVVVYIHGGGWVSGSPRTHRRMGRELASRGFATVLPRYRLAPSFRHPAQLDDCDKAVAWAMVNMAAYGADPTRIAIGGESAGAHLAAATAIRRNRCGLAGVVVCMLLTGIFHYHDGMELVGPTAWDGDLATQPLLNPIDFDRLRDDPVVNPILGAGDLPPSMIGAGALDPLAKQAQRMYAALEIAGTAAALDWRADGPHLCYQLPGLPSTAAALDRVLDWVADYI